MSEQNQRLRQYPEDRFLAPLHHIDLGETSAQLLAESLPPQRLHRQETLYKHGRVTVALFVFETGAKMTEHTAGGVVTVQVLEGRLKMNAEGKSHELSAGQLLVMAPGVRHDVHAEVPTRMLLTVCMEGS